MTISSSVRSSAASISVCARRTVRTDAVPFRVRPSRRSRSSSVGVTRYRFTMISASTKDHHHGFCTHRVQFGEVLEPVAFVDDFDEVLAVGEAAGVFDDDGEAAVVEVGAEA